jgi:hypothetical protein
VEQAADGGIRSPGTTHRGRGNPGDCGAEPVKREETAVPGTRKRGQHGDSTTYDTEDCEIMMHTIC